MAADVFDALCEARVIPVVRTDDAELAELAVAWLCEAGFRTFEITMTIPGAADLIARLAGREDLLVGAGTVMTADEARTALDCGARFVVSPCVVPDLPAICHAYGAACLLGALSPTEVRAAVDAGADAVKIFPVASAGGPRHLRLLAPVFPGVPLVPTGGITVSEVGDYIAAGAAFVGLGGTLVDQTALKAGEREKFVVVARHARASGG